MIIEKIKQMTKSLICDNNYTCEICRREIFDGGHFCKSCKKQLVFNSDNICGHCGRKVNVSEPYCIECKSFATGFDLARSVFNYEGEIKKLIYGFKYENKQYLADVFADFFCDIYYRYFIKTDYIIYVPMHIQDLKKRGYNQSELLAKSLSQKVNKDVAYGVLEKIKQTKEQKSLSRKQRLTNLKGVYRLKKRKIIKNKNILIVDDVLTTGMTAHTIAEKLKKAGAESVDVITAASVSFMKKKVKTV